MSPVIEKIAGFSAQEMISMSSMNESFNLIHPDDRSFVTAGFAHRLILASEPWSTGSSIRTAHIAGLQITL